MKAKRWLCALLSLVLCLQLLPTVAFADTASYSIEVPKIVEGGTATITTTAPTLTVANGKVSGITAATQFVTISAIPAAGYKFTGWEPYQDAKSDGHFTKITISTMLKNMVTYGTKADNTSYTLADETLSLSIGAKMKKNLRMVPVFAKAVALTLESADSEKGSLSGATQFFPGGEAVTLTAAPAEGCTFTGCTLAYTEDGAVVPATDYTMKLDGNTVTLSLGANVTKPVTVTGHFVDADEPNFVIPGMDLRVSSGGNAAVVTGWDNDPDEKIVVTFKAINAAQGITVWLKRYNSDKTYTQEVPTDVTFDFSQTENITRNDTDTTIILKGEGISTLLEIPFKVKDGRDNTKAGVIRMELANRVQLKTKWRNTENKGAIAYNGQEYPSKSVIDFPAGMTEDIVMTGVPYNFLNSDFVVSSWEISDGVTTTTQDGGTLTLSPSMLDKFLTITAIYSMTYGMEVDNTAEHGTVTIRSGDDPAASNGKLEKLLPGTSVTVTATADEGYEFYGWQVWRYLPTNGKWFEVTQESSFANAVSNGPEAPFTTNPLTFEVKSQTLKFKPLFRVPPARIGIMLTASGNGQLTGPEGVDLSAFQAGGSLALAPVPQEGCRLDGWRVTYTDDNTAVPEENYTLSAPDADGKVTLTVSASETKAITVTAIFVKCVPVKAAVHAKCGAVVYNGTTYRDGDTITFPDNKETVSLQAVPDEGYTFKYWKMTVVSLTQNLLETTSVQLPESDFEITATFGKPLTYTILYGGRDITNDDSQWEKGAKIKKPLGCVYSYADGVTFEQAVRSDRLSESGMVKGVFIEPGRNVLLDMTVAPGFEDAYRVESVAVEPVAECLGDKITGYGQYDTRWYAFKMPDAPVHVTITLRDTGLATVTVGDMDTAKGTITVDTAPTSGNFYREGTSIWLTATPQEGYQLKSWTVTDENGETLSVTASGTDPNRAAFSISNVNVVVTAEFEPAPQVTPEITSVALLQGKGGDELAAGVPSGDKWTITIPDTISAETVELIPEGTSGLYLKIVTPTGVTVKQVDGGGSFAGDWSKGDILCYMPVNEEVTFQAIAGTATKDYTIELVYAGADVPTLEEISVSRTSDKNAAVKFRSSEQGNYYYKVVNQGAEAPTVDAIVESSTNGTAIAGENTITLTNLTTGARDIYIVVVSASGSRSTALKIEIPAYGGTETPDEGDFSIYVRTPKGGTITTNRTKANEGDEIIVTVTPNSGYQMVEGSLCYGFAEGGAPMDKVITNNRFKMPAGDINITCQWETATTTAKGITRFSINGVAGAVNNTTNTITITMPRGTDVTKLAPVIATNGVKSLTPSSGETVNFTNSVTYTATMEDGSTKTYTVTVYVDKGTLADQFWDKLTDFYQQVPWWKYAEQQQSSSKYPKYW